MCILPYYLTPLWLLSLLSFCTDIRLSSGFVCFTRLLWEVKNSQWTQHGQNISFSFHTSVILRSHCVHILSFSDVDVLLPDSVAEKTSVFISIFLFSLLPSILSLPYNKSAIRTKTFNSAFKPLRLHSYPCFYEFSPKYPNKSFNCNIVLFNTSWLLLLLTYSFFSPFIFWFMLWMLPIMVLIIVYFCILVVTDVWVILLCIFLCLNNDWTVKEKIKHIWLAASSGTNSPLCLNCYYQRTSVCAEICLVICKLKTWWNLTGLKT